MAGSVRGSVVTLIVLVVLTRSPIFTVAGGESGVGLGGVGFGTGCGDELAGFAKSVFGNSSVIDFFVSGLFSVLSNGVGPSMVYAPSASRSAMRTAQIASGVLIPARYEWFFMVSVDITYAFDIFF
jgi:hypothetical protein